MLQQANINDDILENESNLMLNSVPRTSGCNLWTFRKKMKTKHRTAKSERVHITQQNVKFN